MPTIIMNAMIINGMYSVQDSTFHFHQFHEYLYHIVRLADQ